MKKEKITYSYHPITFEYSGKVVARRSPLDKKEVYLLPKFSTEIEPIFEKNKITKFNVDNKQWFLEEIIKPKEKTEEEKQTEKFENEKQIKIINCKSYLEQTDYHIIRSVEMGVAVKKDILKKRALARSLQDEIEVCKSLEELENININFE